MTEPQRSGLFLIETNRQKSPQLKFSKGILEQSNLKSSLGLNIASTLSRPLKGF